MKSRIILFLLFVLCTTFTFSQYSKKRMKEIDSEIELAYTKGEFNQVINWCKTLLVTKATINPQTFEYWLNSAFQIHDLNISLSLLELYEKEYLLEKNYKKLSEDAFQKLEKLRQINTVFDRSMSIVYEDKVSNGQKVMIEKIIAIDSSFWQPYMMLGEINYFMADYRATITAMEKLIVWKPEDIRALQMLGYSYYNIKYYKKSLMYLSKVDEPYDLSVYLNTIAYCYYNLENYKQAMWHSKEALKQPLTHEQKLSAYSLKLNSERNLGRPQDELKTLYKYLTIDTLAINKSNISYTAELSKKTLGYEQSLINAKLFANQYPTNKNFLLLKIEHYTYNDETYFDEAVRDYDKLVKMTPNNRELFMDQGLYLFNSEHSKEQRELALTAFKNAYQLDSMDFKVHEYICRLYLWHDTKISKEYKKKAIHNMRLKISGDKSNGMYYVDLAKSFDLPTNGYGNNNIYLDSMLKYYNKALALNADTFSVYAERRHVYRSLKQFEKSTSDHMWIAEHTKYDETRRQCYYAIANNYMSLEQFEDAKKIILRIKEEFPDDKHTSRWMRTINSQLN